MLMKIITSIETIEDSLALSRVICFFLLIMWIVTMWLLARRIKEVKEYKKKLFGIPNN